VSPSRRVVLAAVVCLLGILTGAILLEVLGTILFAITVAFVLVPVKRWLVRRGLSDWSATLVGTLVGFGGTIVVFAPLVVTLYFRRGELIGLVEQLPAEVPLSVLGVSTTINMAEVQALAATTVRSLALSFAAATPELAIKFALFGILLFALIHNGHDAARAALAPVPPAYRDFVEALTDRARETLYAIYVLQIGTAIATFAIGYPLFWLLGYDSAFTLAMGAAVLQFVPIIGPSLLIIPLALYQIAIGNVLGGVLLGVLGVGLVAWVPDIIVRPRLARHTTGMPGSLYFVGFTGGLFTLGAIGIVVGPLIVAVFVEAVSLLADEVNPGELPPELRPEEPGGSSASFAAADADVTDEAAGTDATGTDAATNADADAGANTDVTADANIDTDAETPQ